VTTNQAEPEAPAATAEAAGATTADDPAIADLAFDPAFAELRAAIEELEAGGLPLEETIRRTERAVALQRHCERLLSDAEQRVRQLVARPGGGQEARDLQSADEAAPD
jgi:exodeoxyribonuclease VII small subunit